jgi:predicted membrane protein
MLSNNHKGYPWRFAIGGWGAFVVAIILFFIFDYNIYTVFGFLTAAIILTIGNAIYVLYTKQKSKGEK